MRFLSCFAFRGELSILPCMLLVWHPLSQVFSKHIQSKKTKDFQSKRWLSPNNPMVLERLLLPLRLPGLTASIWIDLTAFIFSKGTTSMTLKFNYPFCGRLGKRFEGLVLHEVRQISFSRFATLNLRWDWLHFLNWPMAIISASCLIFFQLFHALGLIHTQARPDRNEYIQ